jgi:voltage-gated sodium channel
MNSALNDALASFVGTQRITEELPLRPVMATFPSAWAFFVPFIIIATFTILNLFIGIIVSTMQERALIPDAGKQNAETLELLSRMETDLAELRRKLDAPQ